MGRSNEDWLNDAARLDEHGVPWFGADDRDSLVATLTDPPADGHGRRGVFTKRARIVALQMDRAFKVSTDHGAIGGIAGDWLATNHPDDDPTSDVWPIGAARFEASYEPASPARNRFRLDALPPGERAIVVSAAFVEQVAAASGATWEWGEPDRNGFYRPTFHSRPVDATE